MPRAVVTFSSLTAFRRPTVLDLTDAFVAPDYRVRLTWLYQTYIDSVLFDTTLDLPINATALPLISADLRYYGYSGRTPGNLYDYVYDAVQAPQATDFQGSYSRFGDVTVLLGASDDMFAIFRGGDEVAMKFTAASPPPAGRRREFVLYSNGWYKDAVTGLPLTVEPLPFAAMSNYPYPEVEHYPTDPAHEAYRANWNMRVVP